MAGSRPFLRGTGPVDQAHSGRACAASQSEAWRGVQHVSLEEPAVVGRRRSADLVALDDAIKVLAQLDPRKVQVVEMRFFGGLSVEETAEVLKVSTVTVMRDWSTAKAWLYRELASGSSDGLRSMETSQ
jgi:DNA-directed RNA polymerase specialized sigma24 family protein